MSERIFRISTLLVTLTGILELALSQIQIAVITDVFATDIGFYYFLFIVFGLVAVLNSVNAKGKKNTALLIVGTLAVLASGIKYIMMLLADVAAENVLTLSDISVSLTVTIAGLCIYVFGCVAILISRRGLGN